MDASHLYDNWLYAKQRAREVATAILGKTVDFLRKKSKGSFFLLNPCLLDD
jgi:hypothetical protein